MTTDYWSSHHCSTTVWPRFLHKVRGQFHSSGQRGAECRRGIREVAKQLTGLCPRVVATDRELAVSRQTHDLPNFRILVGSPEGDPLPVRRRTDLRTTRGPQFAYQPPPLDWLTILMATQSTGRGVDPAGTHKGSSCFHGLHPCLKTLPARPSLGRLRLGLLELSASCIAAFTVSDNPTPRFAPRPAGFICSLSSHHAVSTDPERDEVRRPFVTAATPFTKTCEMPSG